MKLQSHVDPTFDSEHDMHVAEVSNRPPHEEIGYNMLILHGGTVRLMRPHFMTVS